MPPMPARYLARWADTKRGQLLDRLGRRCHLCGRTEQEVWSEDQTRLEFDHLNGRTWRIRDYSRWRRMIRYQKEADAGLLAVACKRCNGTDGQRFKRTRRNR